MSLIEQAAKRLEELRRAGAGINEAPGAAADAPGLQSVPESLPTPEAAMRGLGAAGPAARGTQRIEHGEPASTTVVPPAAAPDASAAASDAASGSRGCRDTNAGNGTGRACGGGGNGCNDNGAGSG